MSTDLKALGAAARCAAMRQSFDESFALPVAGSTDVLVDLLAVRVGGDACALRLSDVGGLHIGLHLVPLPNPAPHLLGLAAIRGAVAPVYDLAGLLGYPPAASTRWTAMLHAAEPVGLALECFETHLRVRDALVSIHDAGQSNGRHRHARDAVHVGGVLRPILQIAALIQSIEERNHRG